VELNIAIMRTFVLIRKHPLNHKELQDKVVKPEKKYNEVQQEELQARWRIGFKTNDNDQKILLRRLRRQGTTHSLQ
jgi:hypothetical protein